MTDPRPAAPPEYRPQELAGKAGITLRTLRFYRERGLLPPPRREGRFAWYGEHHLARLRSVIALVERGHTLSTIAELAGAFDAGRDVGELLGLDRLDGPSPVRLAPEELADHFEGEVTPANLASALALGYVRTDGDAIVHISRRLLKASASLVREGVPLAVILDAAPGVRHHTEALAAILAGVAGACAADPRRLRPLVQSVVEAELSLALDRRLGADG